MMAPRFYVEYSIGMSYYDNDMREDWCEVHVRYFWHYSIAVRFCDKIGIHHDNIKSMPPPVDYTALGNYTITDF